MKMRTRNSGRPAQRKNSLYGEVTQTLRKELQEGLIDLGRPLPSERELAERHNVSTITVRQALLRLEREGMVYRVPRVGTFAGPKPKGGPLRRQGRVTIGLLVPMLQTGINPLILAGVEEVCLAEGVHVEVYHSFSDTKIEQQQIQRLRTSEVDGAVIMSHGMDNIESLVQLKMDRIPIVVVDHEIRGLACDFVTSDNAQGGRLAAEHLLAKKLNQYACLAAEEAMSTTNQRKTSFLDTLRQAGMDAPPLISFLPGKDDKNSWLHWRNAYDAALPVLKTMKPPVGVFCHNDYTAVSLYHVARKLRWIVGKDLFLVGFDDDPISRAMTPCLTTIRQPAQEMGVLAANLLLDRLQGRVNEACIRKKILPVELIARESTGCPVVS